MEKEKVQDKQIKSEEKDRRQATKKIEDRQRRRKRK